MNNFIVRIFLSALLCIGLFNCAVAQSEPSGPVFYKTTYTYSADSSKFLCISKELDTMLVCDFKTGRYSDFFASYFYLSPAERQYALKTGVRAYSSFINYNDQELIIKEFTRRCPTHTLVLYNGELESTITGTGKGNNVYTGEYKKYFRSKLIAKGAFIYGRPRGFLTFYSYPLHPYFDIRYYSKFAEGDFKDGIPLFTAILPAAAIFILFLFAIYKKWYPRVHNYIFYGLLLLNTLANIIEMYNATHGTNNGALSLLPLFYLIHFDYTEHILLSLIGVYLLIAAIVYAFTPGNMSNKRLLSIFLFVINLILLAIHALFSGGIKMLN